MTRFELGDQFVELALIHDAIHQRWGARGREVHERVAQFGNVADAATEWARQLRRLEHRGYRSGFHEQRFEALLQENPENVDSYRAYADWLQEQGDPRGIFIVTMLEGHLHDEILKTHAVQLMPKVSNALFTWRHGFLDRVTLDAPKWPRVRRLLRHSSALVLRTIAIENFALGWGDQVLQWNGLVRWLPPTLTRIEVNAKSALWTERRLLSPQLSRLLVATS